MSCLMQDIVIEIYLTRTVKRVYLLLDFLLRPTGCQHMQRLQIPALDFGQEFEHTCPLWSNAFVHSIDNNERVTEEPNTLLQNIEELIHCWLLRVHMCLVKDHQGVRAPRALVPELKDKRVEHVLKYQLLGFIEVEIEICERGISSVLKRFNDCRAAVQ